MHRPTREFGQPPATSIAIGIVLPCACESRRRKSHRLDHHAVLGPPQPGAAGNDRVRDGEGQGTAGERQIIPDQLRTELGEEPISARRSAGRIDQPGKRRTQFHGSIMWQRRVIVINGTW